MEERKSQPGAAEAPFPNDSSPIVVPLIQQNGLQTNSMESRGSQTSGWNNELVANIPSQIHQSKLEGAENGGGLFVQQNPESLLQKDSVNKTTLSLQSFHNEGSFIGGD